MKELKYFYMGLAGVILALGCENSPATKDKTVPSSNIPLNNGTNSSIYQDYSVIIDGSSDDDINTIWVEACFFQGDKTGTLVVLKEPSKVLFLGQPMLIDQLPKFLNNCHHMVCNK